MGLRIKNLNIDGFEQVVEVIDVERSLHAFIAIHDTTFGPALGGIRFLPYETREEALTDVLRLAEGMTYKSAIIGLKTGGGKSTVIWDTSKPKPREMLQAFAEAINYLDGKYIGAEDMNCYLEDVKTIHEFTPHVLGLPGDNGTGDPARFTARGVFIGIQATAQHLWGDTSLKNKKILVQGAGGVGKKIIDHLFWAGADIFISDIDTQLAHSLCHEYDATFVPASEVFQLEYDIFVPCARGAILNDKSISTLKCKAVAGAANNQLLSPKNGEQLRSKGILYAPDYLINAGGLVSVASGLSPCDQHPKKVLFHVETIFDLLLEIFRLADKKNICTSVAADQTVKSLLQAEKESKNALV